MAIRTSAARDVDALVADLSSPVPATRDAAVARLTIIGPRSVERLVVAVDRHADTVARSAALRALAAIGDVRALDPALRAAADADTEVATAAIAVARRFLDGPHEAPALDRLAGIALDRRRDRAVRLAAIDAIGQLDRATTKALWKALRDDPDEAICQRASKRGNAAAALDLAVCADERVPDDPQILRQALANAASDVPLSALHRIVEQIRERERAARGGSAAQWTRARGAAHLALARRGSRLALYDLRDSVEAAASPLPVEFAAAVALVGDRSCLEPIAVAYDRSEDESWRRHLADTFRAIVARERITKRNAVVKKIARRTPRVVDQLWATVNSRR